MESSQVAFNFQACPDGQTQSKGQTRRCTWITELILINFSPHLVTQERMITRTLAEFVTKYQRKESAFSLAANTFPRGGGSLNYEKTDCFDLIYQNSCNSINLSQCRKSLEKNNSLGASPDGLCKSFSSAYMGYNVHGLGFQT